MQPTFLSGVTGGTDSKNPFGYSDGALSTLQLERVVGGKTLSKYILLPFANTVNSKKPTTNVGSRLVVMNDETVTC